MGVDQNIYLGPYVKAYYHHVDTTKTVKGCKKCKSEDDESTFCDKCGSKIKSFKISTKEPTIRQWDLSDNISLNNANDHYETDEEGEFDEKGNKIHFDFWYKGGWNIDEGDTDLTITPQEITDGMAEFRKNNEKDLKIIEEKYDKVEYYFGLLQWYT